MLALVIALLVFMTGPGDLSALGPAPYPTGPVEFEVYEFEQGLFKTGEKAVYEFTWNGIRAAQGTMTISEDPDRPGWICGKAEGKTIGAPALLYRANDWASSCLDPKTLKGGLFQIQIRESLDYYDMTVKFDHEKGAADRVKKRRTKTTEKKFEFTNAFCPVGAAGLIRSLPWKLGDERSFEVIDGNERYLLVMAVAEEGEITVPAGTFKAVRFQPSIFEMPKKRQRETAGYWKKRERKDQSRIADMTSFSFWMASEPPRPFLKVKTDVYFGYVEMQLVEFKHP
jgi:hypothetical protein